MTRLRVASLNLSGVQSGVQYAKFLRRCQKWSEEDGIGMYLCQEHNLDPKRIIDLKHLAERTGFDLIISFAEQDASGSHRGGTLVLVNLGLIDWPALNSEREERLVHSEPGATIVRVTWNGRDLTVGSIYAPAPPTKRLDFFEHMRTWIKPDMILGGDWNCVPDVTLDVKSKDPLRYLNIGGALLEDITSAVGLLDFRRTQIGNETECTKIPTHVTPTNLGDDMVITRLDRFYIPTDEAHEDLLPSLTLRWDILWSKVMRDHAAVVLDLDDCSGEAGHQRHTIRETITSEAPVQKEITRLVNEAYGNKENKKEWQKWEAAERKIKDYLLKETAKRKVTEKKEIYELRGTLRSLTSPRRPLSLNYELFAGGAPTPVIKR